MTEEGLADGTSERDGDQLKALLTVFRGAVTALPRPAPAPDAPPRPRVGKVDVAGVVVVAAADGSAVGGAAGVAVAVAVAGLPAPRPRPRVSNEEGTGVAAAAAAAPWTLGDAACVGATSFPPAAADPGKLITSPAMLLPLPLPLLIVVPPLYIKFLRLVRRSSHKKKESCGNHTISR
jgi:hypothetical protein